MCQYKFISCNKRTILVANVGHEAGYEWGAMEGTGKIWEISVSFAHSYCEPKTALNNKAYL